MAGKAPRIVMEMSRATGVDQADVAKVLNKLGLGRIHMNATARNGGKQPGLKAAKVAFKVGRSTIIV
jgi:hypothetical protein